MINAAALAKKDLHTADCCHWVQPPVARSLPTPQAASCHWVRPPVTVAGIFLRRLDRLPQSRYSLSLSLFSDSLPVLLIVLDCLILRFVCSVLQVNHRKSNAAGTDLKHHGSRREEDPLTVKAPRSRHL